MKWSVDPTTVNLQTNISTGGGACAAIMNYHLREKAIHECDVERARARARRVQDNITSPVDGLLWRHFLVPLFELIAYLVYYNIL